MNRHSAIYEGWVRHRRFQPVGNNFQYSLFMMYVDLDEITALFRGRWLWSYERANLAQFRRADYLGDPRVPLADAVRKLVLEKSGKRPGGPIRMLTHLRYFGYCYNPVTFYFCYDASDRRVETIVAEINNTPWNERYPYVLTEDMNEAREAALKRYRFRKSFHISPFMEMEIDYDWRFTAPGQEMAIHMDNLKNGEKLFDATMTLRRREVTGPALARVLALYPFMTAKVIGGIYFQSLRLWLKRCPFFTHPSKRDLAQRKADQ